MPGSRPDGKPWVVDRIKELEPSTILDVGPGRGTYWDLLHREVKASWTGVEIFAPYVRKYHLARKYDRLIIGDFLDVEVEPHDVVILGDVLEHVPRGTAQKMWDKARALGTVICVVPIDHYEQGTVFGNVHETHLWHPSPDDIYALGGVTDSWVGQRKAAFVA